MSKRVLKIRRAYDRVGYPMEQFDASRTKQQFLLESDINNLMKRYHVTGLMRQVPGAPMYLDCTLLPVDYQDALNKVVAADLAFSQLSSDVRAQFGNDPAAFVEFASDPENIEQLREWRLAKPAPGPAPKSLDDVVSAIEATSSGTSSSEARAGTAPKAPVST